jgi:dTDP-glucose 4,6-dehydratase
MTMNEFWKEKKVLITGAGGFIGSHLVEKLHTLGADVRSFVRYTSRNDHGLLSQLPPDVLRGMEIIGGDIRDGDAISKAVAGVDVVFHLGALISIPYSYLHPREVAESNFIGTLNVLMACQAHHIARLIHTSTSEVYGSAIYVPIDEKHPLQGQSPYSASKIGADKLAESFYRTYDLPVVTIRPFNTYGPRQSARAVIPAIITQTLAGKTIRLGNLDAKRDFTFVEDTVDGFLRAAEVPNVEGQTLNLGTGHEVTIGELTELIFQIVGKQAEVKVEAERLRPEKSEVMQLMSDNSLAKKILGWEPRISLNDGLVRTVEWIRSHLDMYSAGKYEI